MWRALKPFEKQAYIDVAVSMKPKDSPEMFQQNQHPVVNSRPVSPVQPVEPPKQVEPVKLILPKLHIIPRAGKWDEISKLSQNNQ